MLNIICASLLIGITYGVNPDLFLANGPTYIPSNDSHYMPYGNPKYDIKAKLMQVDPYTGLWIMILKGGPGSELGIHRHYDQVYGYTLKGAWAYREHPEWLSRTGDIVHETPGSVHSLYIDKNHGETEVLFFVWGALEYLDQDGKTLFIEDWRSMGQKYLEFCEKNHLPVVDISYPKDKVPDVHFHDHDKHEL
jgi:quercetin dioxygenase-like cupin family protein